MTDTIGRMGTSRLPLPDRYQAGDIRGEAVASFMFLMQYRRDLYEAREVLLRLYPNDAAAIDLDIQQADKAVRDAALELAASRGEIPAENLAPEPPDIDGFYREVANILGPGGSGAARLYQIDREYPGIDRNLRSATWDIALAGVGSLLANGVVTQQEYDLIQAAWDTYRLGRPAA